jgi:cobalt transporter subunit CbtB
MRAITTTGEATAGRTFAIAERLPALLVLAFGLVILYAAGFSPFTRAHNAAHDTRHANGFPCH